MKDIDLCGFVFVFVILFICDGVVDYVVIQWLGKWFGSFDGVKGLVVFGYVGEGIFFLQDE